MAKSETLPVAPAKVTAWTTYDELSADQRARFGGYVLAKDQAARAAAGNQARNDRADAALKAAGSDKAAALALMLGGR